MLRITSIGLLFFYLVSFTEFREVLRLPILIQHFVEHRTQVEDMSFLEFLAMHYSTNQAHDDQDMRLPFKDCSHSFGGQSVVLPLQKLVLSERSGQLALVNQSIYLQHEPQLLSLDIFQPPKL
jgi:hypothetical protein